VGWLGVWGFVGRMASESGKVYFEWGIEGVSEMVEGVYVYSESFEVEGSWFRLQYGRIKRDGREAFGLFLAYDLPKNKVVDFCVKVESQFYVRNMFTNEMEATHLPSLDTYDRKHVNLGYFDPLKRSWGELVGSGSIHVALDDTMVVGVMVKALDKLAGSVEILK